MSNYHINRRNNPAALAVSVEDARLQCSIDDNEFDQTLINLIRTAEQWTAEQTQTSLIETEWTLTVDKIDDLVRLPRWPVVRIDAIRYTDENDADQTVDEASYRLRPKTATHGRSELVLTNDPVLPTYKYELEIDFVAGFGSQSCDVPETYRQLILLLVAHWFANREAAVIGTIATDLPLAVQSLVDICREPAEFEGLTG